MSLHFVSNMWKHIGYKIIDISKSIKNLIKRGKWDEISKRDSRKIKWE